ncbi:integrase core domain-containing protein [Streptomyces sp. PU_AKi4]
MRVHRSLPVRASQPVRWQEPGRQRAVSTSKPCSGRKTRLPDGKACRQVRSPRSESSPAIALGTRRLHLTGVTAHPTGPWAVQQARNPAADSGTRTESPRFVLRDRDTKYTEAFDAVFPPEDADVLLNAPRAPRMNTHCERVTGTIRREALDHVLIAHEAQARRVPGRHQDHYNGHRPH